MLPTSCLPFLCSVSPSATLASLKLISNEAIDTSEGYFPHNKMCCSQFYLRNSIIHKCWKIPLHCLRKDWLYSQQGWCSNVLLACLLQSCPLFKSKICLSFSITFTWFWSTFSPLNAFVLVALLFWYSWFLHLISLQFSLILAISQKYLYNLMNIQENLSDRAVQLQEVKDL